MGTIQVATSSAASTRAATADILEQLDGREDALLAVFFADRYDGEEIATQLRSALPDSTSVIGCSSAGEIGPLGYQKDSLVVLALPADDFSVSTLLIDHLAELDMPAWRKALEAAVARQTAPPGDAPEAGCFALAFIDGLSLREEAVGHAVQALIGQIPLVGGSAGDGLHFERTQVIHQGIATDDAAVIALVRSRRPFHAFKTQHFGRTNVRMVVTEARPAERIVTEINGLPAAEEYARQAGVPIGDLDPMAFAAYPVLVRIGGSEHVRSIQKVNDDGSLSFYCAIEEGIVLTLADGMDPLQNLTHSFDAFKAFVGEAEVVLACDCILRRLEFEQRGTADDISDFLQANKVVGFSTYGELFRGVHVNQTFTAIAFGKSDEPEPGE